MKTAILVAVEQLSFGIAELTNRYAKNVQKHIKFQKLKNAIQNTNLKPKSSMLGCPKMAHNEKVLLPLFFTMAYNTVLVGEANS